MIEVRTGIENRHDGVSTDVAHPVERGRAIIATESSSVGSTGSSA